MFKRKCKKTKIIILIIININGNIKFKLFYIFYGAILRLQIRPTKIIRFKVGAQKTKLSKIVVFTEPI